MAEDPTLGSTEYWYLINPTGDSHPIHLHLVQFQVVARAPIDAEAYTNAWLSANLDADGPNGFQPLPINVVPNNINVAPFVTDTRELP